MLRVQHPKYWQTWRCTEPCRGRWCVWTPPIPKAPTGNTFMTKAPWWQWSNYYHIQLMISYIPYIHKVRENRLLTEHIKEQQSTSSWSCVQIQQGEKKGRNELSFKSNPLPFTQRLAKGTAPLQGRGCARGRAEGKNHKKQAPKH